MVSLSIRQSSIKRFIFVTVLVASTILLTSSAQAGKVHASGTANYNTDTTYVHFYPETQHNLYGGFKTFFESYGGVPIFGLPLTEPFWEGNFQVQYFERARFEYHPQNPAPWNIELGLLGRSAVSEHHVDLPVLPVDQNDYSRYITATGHIVSGGFRQYWESHNGATMFGNPTSEELSENGQTVQYFEWGKFELHPNEKQIIVAYLIDNINTDRSPFHARSATETSNSIVYFKETGHYIGTSFLDYWQKNGGLPVFGLPISEVATENNYQVQYFERARLEFHPEFVGTPYSVELGHLGLRYVQKQVNFPTQKLRAHLPMELIAQGESHYAGSTTDRAYNIHLAASKFNNIVIAQGAIFSFNDIIGDISEATGYHQGYVIIGNKTVEGVGGGVCQVATTAFRGAFFSGLPFIERYPHSYRVTWYEPPLGLDATVYEGSTNFRFKNTLTSDLVIGTNADNVNGVLLFSFYGVKPGYTITYDGPYVSNETPAKPDVWSYDANLPYGTIKQVDWAKTGLDATLWRVFNVNGVEVNREKIFSHYEAWPNIYSYGPGVTPPAPGDGTPGTNSIDHSGQPDLHQGDWSNVGGAQ